MPIQILDDAYYTIDEIAELTVHNPDVLRRAAREGELRAFREGKRFLVVGADLRAWLLRDQVRIEWFGDLPCLSYEGQCIQLDREQIEEMAGKDDAEINGYLRRSLMRRLTDKQKDILKRWLGDEGLWASLRHSLNHAYDRVRSG